MAQWIKCSDQLPPSLDMQEVFYKLDGKRKDGILLEAKDGGIFFEYKEAAMFNKVEDLSRVEWLDESIPASVEEAARYREALEKIQERCIEGIYTEVDVAFIHETTTEALNNK